jgi:hypothetical protein
MHLAEPHLLWVLLRVVVTAYNIIYSLAVDSDTDNPMDYEVVGDRGAV